MLSVAVVAGAIIRQRTDNFDPSTYHDRHQEALQLLEAEVHAERARYAAAAAARISRPRSFIPAKRST
jgi:non-homologous end joining protein Ku